NCAQDRLANRTEQAAQDLLVLDAIGEALASIGGDRLIRDTLQKIRMTEEEDKARVLILANGFARYQSALEKFASEDFSAASKIFGKSLVDLRDADSPFSAWPLLYLAICDYYNSDYS